MSIPVSTVPLVKSFLLKGLPAVVTQESGYQMVVCLDDPGMDMADDIISIGEVAHRRVQPWQIVGSGQAGAMIEHYRLNTRVSVFRGGEDLLWPYTRAWTLASAIETLVRSDPSLGGLVIQAWPVDARDSSEWESSHKGRMVTVEIGIEVEAGL